MNNTSQTVSIKKLTGWDKNPRGIKKDDYNRLKKQIQDLGVYKPLLVNEDYVVLGGNMRLKVLTDLGVENVWVSVVKASTPEMMAKYALSDNDEVGYYDEQQLAELLTPLEINLDDYRVNLGKPISITELLAKFGIGDDVSKPTLSDRFLIPPFSVLDARQGYWQDRKRAWLSIGIQSELGREARTFAKSGNMDEVSQKILSQQDGQSIFDPVMCELAYKWFTPSAGTILDPFAGGSVRGIVATYLGYKYTGIDLSTKQIEANKLQGKKITPDNQPQWHIGDSQNIDILAKGEYDFIFSCPPYFDLEVYSESEGELSQMSYEDFISTYKLIVKKSVAMLKDDRFACFIVGDIRDKKGFYRNFPAHTIDAFQEAGMTLYNEAILVTAVGSLPIRVGRAFSSGRKLGKTHQNVLIFYKGDTKKIKENYGEIEITDIIEQNQQI